MLKIWVYIYSPIFWHEGLYSRVNRKFWLLPWRVANPSSNNQISKGSIVQYLPITHFYLSLKRIEVRTMNFNKSRFLLVPGCKTMYHCKFCNRKLLSANSARSKNWHKYTKIDVNTKLFDKWKVRSAIFISKNSPWLVLVLLESNITMGI